jgi:hypothetical protein
MSYSYTEKHLGDDLSASPLIQAVRTRYMAPGTGSIVGAIQNVKQSVPKLVGTTPGPGAFIPSVPITAVEPAPIPIVETVSSNVPVPGRIDYSGLAPTGFVESSALPSGAEPTTNAPAPAATAAPAGFPPLALAGLAALALFIVPKMFKRARRARA